MSNVRRQTLVAIASDPYASSYPLTNKTPDLKSLFANHCFHDDVQRERLPKSVYESLRDTIRHSHRLDPQIADAVAKAMHSWAIEHGATHFSHWFQPMTGSTAEKHDCFVTPLENGKSIGHFSGDELIRGEPDASSFPSGGLRATFEARGYTTWDPSSPAFVFRHRNGANLVIPTVFVSWTGEALDMRTPLLRSMAALETQALRVLRLFGNDRANRVYSTTGAEQEYFLIDRRLAALRPDLLVTGRTLFGARPPKGQELEDNYFGAIPERVLGFMTELEYELLLLGIPCRTRHNEVAPAQFELAPLFEPSHLAADHQMLIMQLLRSIAVRHGFHCLLHEKPFEGINGSGKHNNWSFQTDTGENLLAPGNTPDENLQFLFFCAAMIRAVHRHGDLLRLSVSGAGNDRRLGANEAPPTIMSIFIGGALGAIFEQMTEGKNSRENMSISLEIGVTMLPPLVRHSEDRNRTSPFAFTGNKFEFRAVGASHNPARSTAVINTIVAESLDEMTGELETSLKGGKKFPAAVRELIVETVRKHKAVIFNGNCYSREWSEEAQRRGLPILPTTADCLPLFGSRRFVELFSKYDVLSEMESRSRHEIYADNYVKVVSIEAATAIEVAGTMILQAALKYKHNLADVATTPLQQELLDELNGRIDGLIESLRALKKAYRNIPSESFREAAEYCRDTMVPALDGLRKNVDKLEECVDDDLWPLPTYTELLFSR